MGKVDFKSTENVTNMVSVLCTSDIFIFKKNCSKDSIITLRITQLLRLRELIIVTQNGHIHTCDWPDYCNYSTRNCLCTPWCN